MLSTKASTLTLLACVSLVGCETTLPTPQGAVPITQLTTIPYPAVAPDVPQMVGSGGPVMTKPKVVAITYPNDPLQPQIADFTSKIGATKYWSEVATEYGVGPLTALTPIQLTDPAPATLADSDIETFLTTMLDGTHPDWPEPDGNTIYALFYPSGTAIDDGSGEMSCTDYGGYHKDVIRLTDGAVIAYAVLPRCTPVNGGTLIDTLTYATSHELIEASTDPAPFDNPAYIGVDDDHLVWQFTLTQGNEVADMCELDPAVMIKPAELGYAVTRVWSNAAATAGQNPCVPAATTPEPYVYVTPALPPDSLPFDIFMTKGTTLGYAIPVGQSRTIELAIISSAPTTAPINVTVAERPFHNNTTPTLSFKMDQTSGDNGTRIMLTVTAIAASNAHFGFSPFAVEAQSGDQSFDWFGLIAAK